MSNLQHTYNQQKRPKTKALTFLRNRRIWSFTFPLDDPGDDPVGDTSNAET